MADVSTLKINDNSYNIKDATARRNITTLTSTVDAKLDTSHVVDNLTTTASGYALDARAGKALNDAKLNASNVINNLTTTASGYALDARAGKALNDAKLNASNVVNNLTTTASGYALDARQGKSLGDALTSQTKYITHVSLTGQTVNSDGQLYIHIPVDFRYALVVLRGVIPSVSSFYLSGMFFTNYYNISNFTEIDKSADVLSQQVTFGTTSGHPVLIIRLGTNYVGRSVNCDIAVVACSLKG